MFRSEISRGQSSAPKCGLEIETMYRHQFHEHVASCNNVASFSWGNFDDNDAQLLLAVGICRLAYCLHRKMAVVTSRCQERRKRGKEADFQKACAERHEEMRKAIALAWIKHDLTMDYLLYKLQDVTIVYDITHGIDIELNEVLNEVQAWSKSVIESPSLRVFSKCVVHFLMLFAIGLCGSFRIADGACLAAGPDCQVYESAMSQDSEQRHLAAIAIDVEREMDHIEEINISFD